MSNSLENWEKFEAFTEAYEIVKSAKIVGQDGGIYRIDILQDYTQGGKIFMASYYIQESYTIQPTYPQTNEKFDRTPEDVRIWRVLSLMPQVFEDSPENALNEALDSLAKRTRRPSPKNKGPKDEKIVRLFKPDKNKE